MDDRIIQFIDALRAAGVRVSVAESADALRAIEATGIADKDLFRAAMRATLIKEAHDIPEFERLFPSYFGSGAPPMPNQPGGGMSPEDREKLAQMLEQMLRNMTPEQLRQLFEAMMRGANMMRRAAEERREQPPLDELLDRPFDRLRYDEIEDMRAIITRLAALLRSRAALRQRRGNKGKLDAKATIRANQRFGGVPLDVRHKKRHLKPKLSVICDLSTSMRPIVSFMLMLVYGLQDQLSRTRSYAFVADLYDISNDFNEARPDLAIEAGQERNRPGHSNTDLGNSLATYARDHMGTVDYRTTVIFLGDGRNNYNDPNLGDFEMIKRRARKVVWFNPEHPRQWGTGDSDMPKYVPLCDAVHQVSNLRQLVDAVDSLFTRR